MGKNPDADLSSITAINDRRSDAYPSFAVAGTPVRLHVFDDGGSYWSVWLNTEASDFDGVCLVTGEPSRQAAVAAAQNILTLAALALGSYVPDHDDVG